MTDPVAAGVCACGAELNRCNKSGRCRACAARLVMANPQFKAAQIAGVRSRRGLPPRPIESTAPRPRVVFSGEQHGAEQAMRLAATLGSELLAERTQELFERHAARTGHTTTEVAVWLHGSLDAAGVGA